MKTNTRKDIYRRAAVAAFLISSRHHEQAMAASWVEQGLGPNAREGFRRSEMARNLGRRLQAECEAM